MRDDAGQTYTLEAVLVAIMLLGGVAFVVSFEAPTIPQAPATARLEQETGSSIDLLSDIVVAAPKYGNNTLSKLIAEALQGDPDNLTTKLRQYLPPGAHVSLYLSNGHGERLTILDGGTPTGQAVSIVRPLDPKWSYTFLATDLDKYDSATRTAMDVYAIPIVNGNVLDVGGAPVAVTVTGKKLSGGTFTLTTYANTVQSSSSGPDAVSHASLYYLDGDGDKTVYVDARDATRDTAHGLAAESEPVSLRLGLSETEGVAIAAGTVLNIHLPPNWEATAAPGENPGWTILSDVTNPNVGGTLRASLNSSLRLAEIQFNYTAILDPGQVNTRYDVFTTYLTGRVHARSELLVRLGDDASTQGEVEEVYLTAPSPMGRTSHGTWGIAIKSPATNLTIHRIEISQPDGLAIFGNLTVLDGPEGNGWLTVDGLTPSLANATSRLIWEGEYPINYVASSEDREVQFVLEVGGAAEDTPTLQRDPLPLPIDFEEGASGHYALRQESAPGLYSVTVYPTDVAGNAPGYANPTLSEGEVLEVTTEKPYRLAYLTGEAEYTITPIPVSKDSFSGGHLSIDDRTVPIGEDIGFTVDVSSTVLSLSRANLAVNVTLKIFAPWSGITGEPVEEISLTDAFLLEGGVTSLALGEVTDDDVVDVLVGTDNGKVYAFNGTNGYKVAGRRFAVDTASDAPAGSVGGVTVVTPTVLEDGSPGFLVGTNQHSSKVYILDSELEEVWSITKPLTAAVTNVTGNLGFNVPSVRADLDFTGDGVPEIVFAQDTGYVFAYDGAGAHGQLPGFPVSSATEGTFLMSGTWGFDGEDGVYYTVNADPQVTTGWEDPVSNAQAAKRCTMNPVTGVPGCTQLFVLEQVQRFQLQTGSAGAHTFDALGAPIWDYPLSFSTAAFADLNGDGVTDILGGDYFGLLFALNGTQPGLPTTGSQVLSGTPWVDMEFLNANDGFWVNHDGMFQFTDDGATTRNYYYDEITDMVSVPGANGLGMVNRSLGYVVGDLGSLWRFEASDFEEGTGYMDQLSFAMRSPGTNYQYNNTLSQMRSFQDVAFGSATVGLIVTDVPQSPQSCTLNITDVPIGSITGDFCTKPLLLSTSDAADNWVATEAPEGIESDLNEVRFVDATTAFVVGDDGTILKITGAGTVGMAVAPQTSGTTANLHGLHFLTPSHGWVTGDDGMLLETTDGGTTWSQVAVPTTEDLLDVAFLDEDKGVVVGRDSAMLRTWDGGANWTILTPYLGMDWTKVAYPAEDIVHGAGGGNQGTDTRGHLWMGTRRVDNSATLNLNPALGDAQKVWNVTLTTTGRQTDQISVAYQVSLDNGTTWHSFSKTTGDDACALDNRVPDCWQPLTWLNVTDGSITGLKLRTYHNLSSASDAYQTPLLKGMVLAIDYLDDDGLPAQYRRTITFSNTPTDGPSLMESGSFDWNSTYGELRAPIVPQFWAFNANNASILALNASEDFNGDGTPDVVVGTGAIYNTVTAVVSGYDNRVYVLNGLTGGVLWRSDSFPGEIRHIAVPDLKQTTGDSVPDIVVTYWDPDGNNPTGGVASINGDTFEVELGEALTQRPTAIIAGPFVPGAVDERTAIGTAKNSTTDGSVVPLSGEVYLFGGNPDFPRWRSPVDSIGEFSDTWSVPKGYLFGTYVALAEVKWAEREEDPALQDWAADTVQTAKYLNYFVVTPPSGRLPKTPIYNLEVLAWYDDWQ